MKDSHEHLGELITVHPSSNKQPGVSDQSPTYIFRRILVLSKKTTTQTTISEFLVFLGMAF